MNNAGQIALDAAALTTFAANLAGLPKDEIRKAKSLYIRNAIADFEAQRQGAKGMLWVLGILCIIPLFLIVFIPALIGYRAGNKAAIQKIRNALDVWRDDLGQEYDSLAGQLATAQPSAV